MKKLIAILMALALAVPGFARSEDNSTPDVETTAVEATAVEAPAVEATAVEAPATAPSAFATAAAELEAPASAPSAFATAAAEPEAPASAAAEPAAFAAAAPASAPAPAGYTFNNRVGAAWFPTVPSLAFIFVAIAQGLALDEDEKLDYSFSPVLSLEGLYSFNSRISAGVDFGYFTSSYTITKKETGEFVEKGTYMNLLTVMPEFRYNYLDREKVKLYGSVEAGVMMVLSGEFQLNFAAQLNPIGVEFGGSNFFGFTELGVGFSYFGARGGIGYRF